MIPKFRDKKVAIIGSGTEGLSSEKFFTENGAKVTVLDQKQGKNYLDNLDRFNLVVRSPGVKLELLEKYTSGDKITSQVKLFFDLCPCPIIGITGTKGKGTTSSLIYEMLKKQGVDAYLGGNIGLPPLDFLDKLNAQSVVVLELSSFQLLDLHKSPHIAVMLMTTSEHLDYHKDTNEYVKAKRNILAFQTKSDFAIINKDYPASNESDIHTEGKVFKTGREITLWEGCFVSDGVIELNVENEKLKIIDTKDILLPGQHNFENVCAAVMAAWLSGVSKENITLVLKTFKGLEHRLELVSEVNGVRFYDDSFSTIPETTIAAIKAFSDHEILILGGSSKNSNFEELGRVISEAQNIKTIIGIGVEWQRIKKELRFKNKDLRIIEGCKNMKEIVQEAILISEPGDVVLLSPACASFDMFKNYKDRGEQFKKEVRDLHIAS
ncbi:MAG: UDP-N-acetylmuramoyl-L-alanine--D-glutamate ligase [Patescibacteria group bacterium]|nr:UDP-N-acetylmuramoyl-L-alanine--D-glutamate ligase [Patescibacteria group bacterium]